MRTSKPITVSLGRQQASIDARLERGDYASASEVVRAALRALDREEEASNALYKARVEEALNDPTPGIPIEDVFERLEQKRASRTKAAS